jgi:hypothetical protein
MVSNLELEMLFSPFPLFKHFSHIAAAHFSLSLPTPSGEDIFFLLGFLNGESPRTWREKDNHVSALACLTVEVNLSLVLADNAVGH